MSKFLKLTACVVVLTEAVEVSSKKKKLSKAQQKHQAKVKVETRIRKIRNESW